VAKRYDQYCPIAHALDLVGERWSLLVVRELAHGPLRYTDIHERLHGCSTNILAARLKELEAGGIVRRRQLPPPAASTVYELTECGVALRPVLRALAWWGVETLGPPPPDEVDAFEPGWLVQALFTAVEPGRHDGVIEFRVGDEVAHLEDGEAVDGPASAPDVTVTTDSIGFFHLFVGRDTSGVQIVGDGEVLAAFLASLPERSSLSAGAAIR
jgi:DNA-binding HxlR family transcriptional regulator